MCTGAEYKRGFGAVLEFIALHDQIVEAVVLELEHEPRVDLVQRLVDHGRRLAVGEHHYAVLVHQIARYVGQTRLPAAQTARLALTFIALFNKISTIFRLSKIKLKMYCLKTNNLKSEL